MDVSYERANELLSYDPLTGSLTWKINRGSAKLGSLAGTMHGSGYLVIRIDRKLYQAHRICWLLFHGSFPENELDHKNLIKYDNRLENLRLATRSQNSFNKPKLKNGRQHSRSMESKRILVILFLKMLLRLHTTI